MIYFTKYSEQKFEILNKHKVFFTKEQVENTVNTPDEIEKKNGFVYARKEEMKVVYSKQEDIIKILTFYPVKI